MLLFPNPGALVGISSKGRLLVREMKGRYHDHGFEFAREAVSARAAREPGLTAVLSQIGGLATVLDLRALVAANEAA